MRPTRAAPVVLAWLAMLSFASAARADAAGVDAPDATGFARRGTWVLWADQGFVWGSGSAATASRIWSRGDESYSLIVRAALDRFVTDWMTVGFVAGGGVSHVDAGGETSTGATAIAGLGLGFGVPIVGRSVFWPRLTAFVARGTERSAAGFEVRAPFVRQISSRFLLGIGPSYEDRYDWASGTRSRSAALQLSFGGAFSGDAASRVAVEGPERFGTPGQWVVGVQHSLAVLPGTKGYLAERSDPGRGASSLVLLGSFDRFLPGHASLGFSAGLGRVGEIRDGVALEGTALFAGFQLGAAIGLGEALVLWPKTSLLWTLRSGSAVRGAQVFLPLAAELGHVVIGLGPCFEMSDVSFERAGSGYTAYALGVTLLIAGWWR